MALTRDHIVSYILTFNAVFGIGLATSFLSIYLDDLGITLSSIGIVFALGAVLSGMIRFPIGALIDSHGRKFLILLGVVGYPVFAIGLTLSSNVTHFAGLNVLLSFFSAIFWTAIMAHIFDVLHHGREGLEIGYQNIMIYVASAIAPLIAGVIIASYGFVNLFYLSAIVSALSIPIALVIKDRHRVKHTELSIKNVKREYLDILHKPGFIPLAAVLLVINFIWTIWAIYMPIYLSNLGFSSPLIGLLMSVNMIAVAVIQIPLGKAIDKFPSYYLVIPGFFLMWLSGYVFLVAKQYVGLLIARVGWGIGVELSWDPIFARMSHITPKREHGGTYALLIGLTSFAGAAASVTGGWLSDIFSVKAVLFWSSVMSFVVGGALIFYKKSLAGKGRIFKMHHVAHMHRRGHH